MKLLDVLTPIAPALRAPIAISLGAIPGALLRYYITLLTNAWLGHPAPIATFMINLTGAALMGFFVTWSLERAVTIPELRLLVSVGFLGSYTTFSTYALDTAGLLQSGHKAWAIGYWLGSATLGLVCLELGGYLAKKITS